MRFAVAAIALAGLLVVCRAPAHAGRGTTVKAKPEALRAPTKAEVTAAKKAGKVQVVLNTEKGAITVEVDGSAAPIAVANFLNLVKAGFYNGMPFHRVEPGFVIQAGDPTAVGRRTVSYSIADERSPIKHTRGTIAMARLFGQQGMIPNSASTQFYICLGDAPHLDKMGFTAFGKVAKGIEVIDKIAVEDNIKTAQILRKGRAAGR